ncbi:hypothetical protein NHX12_031636 [Muraenolepis orangiensis]|uniref:BUB3-interacting and GLEBS motif-containing protein ZNF207 n=1 Tax=Muraenolepis orangiensis TaxID=630683 RepID=A0A9Q0IJV5_9TELE|nr:hypothetical protein NHX12_031636 [Muraenolepis orangiensis]
MQVHKETIDDVPNAIPGRTDIELEIYGMEGIPEKDVEERRRVLEQKTQESQKKKQNQEDSDEYDEDDEPGPSFQTPPAVVQPQAAYIPPMTQPGMHPGPGAPGMHPGPGAPGMHPGPGAPGMPPGSYSGMPPMMAGVPPMMPRMPPGMQGMPPGMMPMGGMMPPGPGMSPMMHGMPPGMPPPPMGHRPAMAHMGQGLPPAGLGMPARTAVPPAPSPHPAVCKPLFPIAGQSQLAAAGAALATQNAGPSPAPGSPGSFKPPSAVTSKPATLTTTTATSKLIHPDEDISLEELRATLPRYQRNIPRQSQATISAPPHMGPMGAVMAPQPPGLRHPMPGQYGGPPQGIPGYMSGGGIPLYGQPMVPPGYQGAPPRPPMGIRPPGGHY